MHTLLSCHILLAVRNQPASCLTFSSSLALSYSPSTQRNPPALAHRCHRPHHRFRPDGSDGDDDDEDADAEEQQAVIYPRKKRTTPANGRRTANDGSWNVAYLTYTRRWRRRRCQFRFVPRYEKGGCALVCFFVCEWVGGWLGACEEDIGGNVTFSGKGLISKPRGIFGSFYRAGKRCFIYWFIREKKMCIYYKSNERNIYSTL